MKIQRESRRLSDQKFVRIVKVHAKTRIKSLSLASSFLVTKHKEIVIFRYSSKALADFLDKTRAKWNVARIDVTSIQNTHEKTHAERNSNSTQVQKPLKTLTKLQ